VGKTFRGEERKKLDSYRKDRDNRKNKRTIKEEKLPRREERDKDEDSRYS
jgi:hypothetical protein